MINVKKILSPINFARLTFPFGLLAAIMISATVAVQPGFAQDDDPDVPYVPTPDHVVERMLDVAQVDSNDYVIDLGSGDGRIVIQAGQRGAAGHGVEIDAEKVRMARKNARDAGVEDKVMFVKEDLFKTDFSKATVITMYLLPSVMDRLVPDLLQKLEPGTRIVSHDFDMKGWLPDREVTVMSDTSVMGSPVIDNVIKEPKVTYTDTTIFDSSNFSVGTMIQKTKPDFSHIRTHDIYLWIVPADAEGQWSWKADGHDFDLTVDQSYKEVDLELQRGGKSLQIRNANLEGRRLKFEAVTDDDKTRYLYYGSIDGDSISGYIQKHAEENQDVINWKANR